MDTETLSRLKQHLRIDHDEDDGYLCMLYAAATEYLTGAGILPSASNLYWLAAAGLVLEWYDAGTTATGLSVGLRQVINQLKLTAVSNTGTGL